MLRNGHVERIEGVDVGGRPNRLAVALQIGEQGEIEERPEEADEEHHLAGDEEQHPIAQAEPYNRRVQSGRAALADHVAPPEEHGAENDDRADDQRDVAAEMRREDDAENGQQAAYRTDDRPRARIDQVIRLVEAGILDRGGAVRFTHAVLVLQGGRRIIANSSACSRGLRLSAARHADRPVRARRTSRRPRACGRRYRTA